MIRSWMRRLAVVMLSGLIAACGGGGGGTGGGGGGGSVGVATATVRLLDSAGNVINPPALAGTQTATVLVTARDASNDLMVGALVAISGDAVTFTPSSGQQLTDTNGQARFQVRASDPFAGGATIIAASVTDGGDGQLAVALGTASATIGAVTANSGTVGAYETVQVSVPVTLTGTSTPASQLPVTFGASCGSFDPEQAVTDSTGTARSTYRNQNGASACSGTVTLTAQLGADTSSTTVTAVAPVAANIQFVGASPGRIYLAGSPGVSQSIVTFRLIDSTGNPVPGENIDLTLSLRPTGTYLGASTGTQTLRQSTASNGTVSVAVNSGAAPGPVQIRATLVSNTSITNVSNTLAVASGLPAQQAFSLSVQTFNIEALTTDGVETGITLRIADRLGNPVPDGTTVNFVSEGGQVVASCNTTGASSNDTSACSVVLSSQSPRPSNGRVTVLAWAQGEETFVDAGSPTNNVYDSGESFEDLGQPFLDKNENGLYDGSDVTVGTASGTSACPAGSLLSTPGTCNGTWAGGALVRAQAVITFSGSDPNLSNITSTTASSRCTVAFTMRDVNGNPLPAGTTLAVSGISPSTVTVAGFGLEGAVVPNTSNVARTRHSVVFNSCSDVSTLAFTLTVRTPAGVSTSFFLP